MTSVAQAVHQSRHDTRTILSSAAQLGGITAVGVVLFALLSRVLDGTGEIVVQSLLVLLGATVFAYFPAAAVKPKDVDTIAWAALVGLLGALVFTVVDTAILRPINLYHWTWDAIGGGSGFWYIPVWWMGSAVLAWLGAWVYSVVGRAGGVNVLATAGQTVIAAAILFFAAALIAGVPLHAAVMAVAFVLGLIVHLVLAGMLRGP